MKKYLATLCLLALCGGSSALAQSTFGSIIGSVKDASGGSISGAEITLLNTDENTRRKAKSGSDGDYEALNLKPGHYDIKVEMKGFDVETRQAVTLDARQTARVDFNLRVGSQQQTVTVTGEAGVIASETDAVASGYGSEKITTLPANFRASTSTTPYPLLQTLPGVQSDGNGTYLSIQGGQPNQTELSIDGISAQSVRQNRPLIEIFPSVDSLAEIKVQGVGNSAEYGSAGDITAVSKGGTNVFHGSAVWNYQNAEFDSIPFGSTSKPEKEVNNYAFNISGPVWLPKIYKGKDKTFFFFTYEGLSYPRTSTFQNYVPTTFMKNGDFSRESGNILDPATGKGFAGNLVPTSRVSSIAKTLQSTFFPDPNNGNTNLAHSNNWNFNKVADIQSKQFDVRGDHYFSSRQQVFARFSWKNATSLNPGNVLQPNTDGTQQNRSLVASYNFSIKANLLNEFRAGFTSDGPGTNSSFDGKTFQKSLGFVGLPSTPFNGITGIGFSNLTGIGGRLDGSELYRTFTINDNLTWNKGKHTFKAGLDIRWMRSKTVLGFVGSDNYGDASFDGSFSGNEYADFLLGAPVNTDYGDVQHDNDAFAQRYQAYVQDSWRASPKLTIEYGVRWDFNPPFHDANGYVGNFDQSVPKTGRVVYPDGYGSLLAPAFLLSVNACAGTPNLPSTGPGLAGVACTPFVTASTVGLGSGLRKSYNHEFFPRFGFAYRPFGNGNTVVRGGFGMYSAPLLGAVLYSLTGTAQTDVRTFSNIGGDGKPIFYWPNTHPTAVSGVSIDAYGSAYFGTGNSINLKNPKMMQYNLSIDRSIGFNTGLRVTYIGSHSIQLGWAQNLNQSGYSKQFYALQPLQARPYPYWGRVENRDSGGTAFYNALQTELNRRYKAGLTFTAAYTWAKNINDTGGPSPTTFGGETGNGRVLDAYNRAGSRGDDYGTRRHHFVATGVYDVPFGKGKKFGGSSRMMDALVGGWQISTIFVAQTGPYLTPYFNGGDPSGTGSGGYRNQHPDLTGNPVPSTQNPDRWIVASAFACPGQAATATFKCNIGLNPASSLAPIGRFGNQGTGIILGPGLLNTSMGFGKSFAIWERVRVRLNGSFTNIFDRTNYATPSTNLGSSSFGKITRATSAEFGGARTGQVGVRIEF